jgi:hypothetical protein
MLNKRVLRIFVCGAAMVNACGAAESDCYYPRLVTEMQIQSLTVDGIALTDLTLYQRFRTVIAPSQESGHPNGFDIGGETYDPQ